jgi:hypothetical protein
VVLSRNVTSKIVDWSVDKYVNQHSDICLIREERHRLRHCQSRRPENTDMTDPNFEAAHSPVASAKVDTR